MTYWIHDGNFDLPVYFHNDYDCLSVITIALANTALDQKFPNLFGEYEVNFNGNELIIGIHFYQLKAVSYQEIRKKH